jgi:tight adherence protein B
VSGVLVAALLAVAVWVELVPGPRRVPPRRRVVPHPAWRLRSAAPVDLGVLLTEVAARLRAGAPVGEAWDRALARWPGESQGRPVGSGPVGAARVGDAVEARLTAALGPRPDPAVHAQIAAVAASCRLADSLGAPLADVLDRCADGVAEAARAEAARRVALAGPASTARVLAWLPVAGLALGWALGAGPIAVLLDGGAGSAAGLAGLGLLAAGRRWTAVLLAAARGGSP